MAITTKIVTAFICLGGVPKTGLSPIIRIWEVTTGVDTLVVAAGSMTEVGDGFYKYVFTSYDQSKNWAMRVDGDPTGTTLAGPERYQVAVNESFEEDISFEVWEEKSDDHGNLSPDRTTGGLLNLLTAIMSNRTRIDTASATMTIYDSDCVTPLIVFNLKDQVGNPSVIEVCERVPTTSPYTDCTAPASTPPDLTP